MQSLPCLNKVIWFSRRALINIQCAERYTDLSHSIVQGPSFGKKGRLRAFVERHFRGSKPLQIFTKLRPITVYISTTNLAARVCVCAKFDQFLPARFYFVSKRPEKKIRIAKFPYAAFGPLFAFHCPLFVTKNNNLGWNRHASPHTGTGATFAGRRYRPLSRRLDRCDRVIHNESGDPNGGNMCSFSGATCTSRVRHNGDYVPYAKIRFDQ